MSATATTNAEWSCMSAVPGGFATPTTGTLLRLENVTVEDLHDCGAVVVDRLKAALRGGVPFTKDRKRKRFYEVQVGNERFYIHVLRGAEKVLLLAHWAGPAEA